MTDFDILVVGDYCLDFIFTGLKTMPELGKEITSSGFLQTPGGACNNVVAMHRLGIKVGWLTNFGTDDYSHFILDQLRKESIPEDYFMFHKCSYRKVTVSLSFPAERAFIAYYDPNPLITSEVKNLPSARGKALIVPGFYLGAGLDFALPIVKAKKMKLIMDGNTNEVHTIREKRVIKVLSALDLFLCNAREARSLTGYENLEDAARALGKFVPEVVIKNGAEGSLGYKEGQFSSVKAIKVKAIDTTGAGDCFNAGFLKVWLENGPQKLAQEYGNIVGGLSTTQPGGIGRTIQLEEVEKIHSRLFRGKP